MSPVTPGSCPICGGRVVAAETDVYARCADCGHERRTGPAPQTFMLNEPLQETDPERLDGLDRFKQAVVRQVRPAHATSLLVDVGCAAGRFLVQSRRAFSRVVGIEVTPAAADFCRQRLGLEIHSTLEAVDGSVSVATFWHSLEHVPDEALDPVLAALAQRLAPDGRVIVSVPNNDSWQYRWLAGAYTYLDVANHPHQFSPDSLRRLMACHGFASTRQFFSWPYELFGWTQSLLNAVTGSHNYLYHRWKRRDIAARLPLEAASLVLLPAAVAVGALLALASRAVPSRQGVLTLCFEKASV